MKYFTIIIALLYSGLTLKAQVDSCCQFNYRIVPRVNGIRIVSPETGVSILLQDTCVYFNRFEKVFFYQNSRPLDKGAFLPAMIIDSTLLGKVESFLDSFTKDGNRDRRIIKLSRKDIRLYIGCYDPENNVSFIIVQLVTKRNFIKNSNYNKALFLIASTGELRYVILKYNGEELSFLNSFPKLRS
jgi:hypothetical protein